MLRVSCYKKQHRVCLQFYILEKVHQQQIVILGTQFTMTLAPTYNYTSGYMFTRFNGLSGIANEYNGPPNLPTPTSCQHVDPC